MLPREALRSCVFGENTFGEGYIITARKTTWGIDRHHVSIETTMLDMYDARSRCAYVEGQIIF